MQAGAEQGTAWYNTDAAGNRCAVPLQAPATWQTIKTLTLTPAPCVTAAARPPRGRRGRSAAAPREQGSRAGRWGWTAPAVTNR